MGKELGAKYYDNIYAHQPRRARCITHQRHTYIAEYAVGDSVLDLGCGVALIADMIGEREYLGVDFSIEAIEVSRKVTANPRASFIVASFADLAIARSYDTVLLVEILEHLQDPAPLAAFALAHCNRRIIVTVPRDMRGPAHVKQAWTCEDIEELLGPLSECHLFGGPEGIWWRFGVRDL